jgi:hypothetical protein
MKRIQIYCSSIFETSQIPYVILKTHYIIEEQPLPFRRAARMLANRPFIGEELSQVTILDIGHHVRHAREFPRAFFVRLLPHTTYIASYMCHCIQASQIGYIC